MFSFSRRFLFILSLICGIFCAIIIKILQQQHQQQSNNANRVNRISNHGNYEIWFKSKNFSRKHLLFDDIRYTNNNYNLESTFLYKQIDILCVILVRNWKNVEAARNTWAKKCNKIVTINLKFDQIKRLSLKRNSDESVWLILCRNLLKITHFKWILIVYDYTFVILENLRRFLMGLNPDYYYYLGHAVKFWSTIYNMGQAGYVLSRGTINKFQKFYNNSCLISDLTYRNREDYNLGRFLYNLNITPVDTRDAGDFTTFQPYNLYHMLAPSEDHYKFSIYPQKCCSNSTIAFQGIEGDKFYTYYYLLYTVQIFWDGQYGNRPPTTTIQDNAAWKVFLESRNISTNISNQQYYKVWEDLIDDPASFAQRMKRDNDVH